MCDCAIVDLAGRDAPVTGRVRPAMSFAVTLRPHESATALAWQVPFATPSKFGGVHSSDVADCQVPHFVRRSVLAIGKKKLISAVYVIGFSRPVASVSCTGCGSLMCGTRSSARG